MSIFSSIVGAVAAVTGLVKVGEAGAKAVKGALGIGGSSKKKKKISSVAAVLPGVGPVARVGSAVVQAAGFLPDIGVPGPGVFSQDRPPVGFHLSKQEPFHFVRNRRMNPLNPKAFRRSVRRIKGAVKFAKEVDRVVPIRPRARRAPSGHRRHLHHD